MRREIPDRPISPKERVRLAAVLVLATLTMLAATPAGCGPSPSVVDDAWGGLPVPHDTSVSFTTETAAYVMKRAQRIMNQMAADYGMDPLPVDWSPCDEENGYYHPEQLDDLNSKPWIGICAEDLEHPGWTIQVAAHEFGHAVTDRFANITDENAADEIAILAMARHGWWAEMLDAAMYMRANWTPEHMYGDPHPGGEYRAWELVCAEAGAEGLADPLRPASPECDALYRGLVVKWDYRIPRRSFPVSSL